jgi:hypothetical protein
VKKPRECRRRGAAASLFLFLPDPPLFRDNGADWLLLLSAWNASISDFLIADFFVQLALFPRLMPPPSLIIASN